MTALDQAFIKAYRQQGAASAAPLDSARPVSLADVLEDQPVKEATDAPVEISVEGVLEALRKTPSGIVNPAPHEPNPRPPQNDGNGGDEPQPGGINASAFLHSGSIHTGEGDAGAAPTVEEFGLPGVVHRLDQATSAEPTGQPDSQPVPPPHIETPVADAEAEADAPTGTDVPADPDASPDTDAQGNEAGGGQPVDRPFRPMLQVDHFIWPKVCRRLNGAAAGELDRLTDALVAVMTQGHKVLAIGGCRPGEGATTLLLCVGRRLTGRGLKVVMVDANLAHPKLARRLGLLPQVGWEEVLAGQLPLDEVVIESPRNRLAVLPVCETFAGTGGPAEEEARLAGNLQTLAAHYDLVLVDLGPLEEPDVVGGALARGIAKGLDAIVLVHNVRATTRDRLAEIQRCLAATNIVQAGIVENFVGG